jgi:flagellar biosynthesis component FlhA
MIEQNTKKKKGSFLTKFFVISALVICSLIALKYWKKYSTIPAPIQAAQEHELIGLSDEYAAQENPDDLSDLTVNEIREKGAEFIYQTLLKNQIKIEDLYSQIQGLKGELAKYRSQEKIGKMIVAYVDLRDKMLAGKNYEQDLKNFETLSASDEVLMAKINKLKPALGLFATKENLAKNFADLIPEIILNKKNGSRPETLLEKVRRNISRLVVIRRIDEKNPQEVDAVVVRIEKFLKQESYQDALGAALSLDQSYHAILKNFLDELSAALEVQQIDQEILNYLKTIS